MVSLIASDMHFIKVNLDIDIQYFKIFLNATLKREFNTWFSQSYGEMHSWLLWRLLTMVLLSGLFSFLF